MFSLISVAYTLFQSTKNPQSTKSFVIQFCTEWRRPQCTQKFLIKIFHSFKSFIEIKLEKKSFIHHFTKTLTFTRSNYVSFFFWSNRKNFMASSFLWCRSLKTSDNQKPQTSDTCSPSTYRTAPRQLIRRINNTASHFPIKSWFSHCFMENQHFNRYLKFVTIYEFKLLTKKLKHGSTPTQIKSKSYQAPYLPEKVVNMYNI